MDYRPATLDDAETIRAFLSRMGWEQRVNDPARFRTLLANSNRTVTVWDRGHLIGFARALCDEVSNGYISMVAIDPSYHGHGIGRKMIEVLLNNDTHITWVLRAGHDSREFWEHLGFHVSTLAMERLRQI